jgi:hypothetical protein
MRNFVCPIKYPRERERRGKIVLLIYDARWDIRYYYYCGEHKNNNKNKISIIAVFIDLISSHLSLLRSCRAHINTNTARLLFKPETLARNSCNKNEIYARNDLVLFIIAGEKKEKNVYNFLQFYLFTYLHTCFEAFSYRHTAANPDNFIRH